MSYDSLGLAALEPRRGWMGGSLESSSQRPTQQAMSPRAVRKSHVELGSRLPELLQCQDVILL